MARRNFYFEPARCLLHLTIDYIPLFYQVGHAAQYGSKLQMIAIEKIRKSNLLGGIVVGLLGWMSVIATIDPSGVYSWSLEGPGITVDESFNVQQGVLLVEGIRSYGPFIIDPVNVKEFFGGESGIPYLPDHPPLGRLLLGLGHHFFLSLFPADSIETVDVTAAARFSSATMFGLTLLMIGWACGRWFGPIASWVGPLSLLFMPRVFGHAHLAALETSVNLFVTSAILWTAASWGKEFDSNPAESEESSSKISPWIGVLPGILTGLAMLTKIQGFLIIPCILVWGLYYGRQRMILPLLVWGLTANIVFWGGWPWLWLDPMGHLKEFLGSSTDRIHLNAWYFGQQFRDVDVPWHYPWVMFLTTVPVGFHLLGAWGLIKRSTGQEKHSRFCFLLGCMLFPLILFSTSVAVYDGSRLFLFVFPIWALFIGAGAERFWGFLQQRFNIRAAQCGIIGLCLISSWGVLITGADSLSYFNLLLGGNAGANALGMERTYWQESLTRSFWEDCSEAIPQRATVSLAPVLHQFQLDDLKRQVPIIRERGWQLIPGEDTQKSGQKADYHILFGRLADLTETQQKILDQEDVLVSRELQGVRVAVLVKNIETKD